MRAMRSLDQPPVGFELTLAGSAKKSKTAALPLQMGPGAYQPAFLIIEMRQLDL